MIMKQQDETLGTISGVVDVLREQASLMGQEISEQNVLVIRFPFPLFLLKLTSWLSHVGYNFLPTLPGQIGASAYTTLLSACILVPTVGPLRYA